MKKMVLEKKMWGKCGVQNQKNWCLGLVFDNPFCGAKKRLFVVLKTAKFGVKIVVLGVEDVKNKPTSPNIWEVNA